MIGRVKFFGSRTKPNIGYAISSEDGKEYRIHKSQIVLSADISRMGKNILEIGEWISFDLGKSPTGDIVATNVKIIDEKEFKTGKESSSPDL